MLLGPACFFDLNKVYLRYLPTYLPRSKLVVSFPVLRGDESEDVFDFIDNFKRAATLNGWTNEDLPIGLPLYLKGHASAWFKSL